MKTVINNSNYHIGLDEWIKMWYIYTMEYSAIKEWNWVICRDVDGLRVCHTEWSKSEKENCILTHICGIQKNGTDEPICRAGIET